LRRLSLDHPTTLAGLTPEVGEAQKIEAARTLTPVTGALKVHQFRLLRVQRQSILPEPLWEYLHYAFRIPLGCKHKYSIVCVTNENGLATEPRQDIAYEPHVQYLMKV